MFFFATFPLLAQVSVPGLPPSFSWVEEKTTLPVEVFYPVETEQLLAEDLLFENIKDIPWRFAEPIRVDLNPASSGIWTELENGDRVWRLGIKSPGALALTLIFDRYLLPEGAQLFVYNKDKTRVLGAFTSKNNQKDYYFATSLIEGDELVVEYYEPHWVAFVGQLNIERVNHAYRDPFKFLKAFGDSGLCNLNVACEEADGWEDQIRSVGLILRNGNSWCTGVLINNTAFDGRPLFLSANHCYTNPGSLLVWFNWQSSTCDNPENPPSYDAVGGLEHRARHSSTDFWLLEFSQPIPENINPYFSGWNRTLSDALAETIVGIHHPKGDIKKFSYSDDGVIRSSYLGGAGSGTTHWRIVWSGGTTTESGSSGSPLFDAQGRIIGQLHGGYAACGNTLPDYYGRLGVSWTGGGTTATRLSDWLDPLGLDPEAIEGTDPYPVEDVKYFEALPLDVFSVGLQWELNDARQHVLIAYNTENIFGTLAGNYYLGQQIDGGGKVIYLGDDEAFVHQGLEPETTYYYKIWSYSSGGKFSKGVVVQATTLCPVVDVFPFSEGFEQSHIPVCWWQEFVLGDKLWQISQGNGNGIPDKAYQGDYNAMIRAEGPHDAGKITRLISPVIDFGDFEIGELSFFYANAANNELQDTLKVYMRVSEIEQWILLASFETDQPHWEKSFIVLPALSSSVQIAFEARLAGGHGVVIDNVKVVGYYDAEFPRPSNLAAVVNDDVNVDLTWEAPQAETSEGNPSLTGYLIYRNDAVIATIGQPDQLHYIDEGLTVGAYTYFVTATYVNPLGESLPSDTVEVEILPAPVQYELTIEIQGNGSTNPAAATYLFNEGSNVTITAFPAADSYFVHWLENDQVISTLPTIMVVIDQNRALTAVFALQQYQVELWSVPPDIGVLSGGGVYDHGQVAEISAVSPPGYSFRHWKEGSLIFSTAPVFQTIINSHREFVAYFDIHQYEVKLLAIPQDGGWVNGGGIFDFGSEINVTAEVAEGFEFDGWFENGQLVSVDLAFSFIVTNPRLLEARFRLKTYQVFLQMSPEDAGVLNGEGIYDHGTTVDVSVNVFDGFKFLGWEENDEIVSTDNPYSFQITSNRNLLARLESTRRNLVLALEGPGTIDPPPGSYFFDLNTVVRLVASANPEAAFVRWEVNEEAFFEPQLDITIDEDIYATAFFQDAVPVGTGHNQNEIRVYPQPASGLMFIEWKKKPGPTTIELLNIGGQRLVLIKEDAAAEGRYQTSIDVGHLNPGVYLLRITGQGFALVKKVLIQ